MAGRHVRTGQTVVVTSGDHKGKTGEIMRIDTARGRVYVRGINLRTKHLKRTRTNPQGGIITREAPLDLSNVSPAVRVDGRLVPTRVRFEHRDDGSRVAVAAKTGEVLHVLRRAPRD